MSEAALTITATEFKAKCLELFDRLARRELDRVQITKRGRTVAVVEPPPLQAADMQTWFGEMRADTHIPPGVDLTEPVFEGEIVAEMGLLHL